MAFDIFGFTIKRKAEEDERERSLISVVPKQEDDGAAYVYGGGYSSSTYYNLDFSITNEVNLINKYREMSLNSEVESAIDEIVNECFYIGDNEVPVNIILDKIPYSDDVKKLIREEFDNILTVLNFGENAYELFKRWYVDGRLYFNIVIDTRNPKDGIQELRYIDPRKVKKIKEVKEEKYRGSIRIPILYDEWYVYNADTGGGTGGSLKLPKDSVAAATSGLVDEKNGAMILSYLHSAIKPFNQLRMMEDAMVIYNMARAPERRVFKIDVGNMPKIKAEQYVNEMMNRFKNKVAYDSNTGDLKDDTRTLSMLEDFWFPVREGGRGADVSVLAGGNTEFGITQTDYYNKKLYRALHVPVGRLDTSSVFNTGRATEIAREESKFTKFIQRLRFRFSILFNDILRKQLILKNIITPEDWENHFKNNVFYSYKQDSHFAEFNEAEILNRRMELAQQADQLGTFSNKYINKKILKLTDEEIEEITKDRELEGKKKKSSGGEMMGGMGDFGDGGGGSTSVQTPIEPEPPEVTTDLAPETPEIPPGNNPPTTTTGA